MQTFISLLQRTTATRRSLFRAIVMPIVDDRLEEKKDKLLKVSWVSAAFIERSPSFDRYIRYATQN